MESSSPPIDSSRLVYLHMFGSNRRDCRCSVCIDKVITSQTRTREQSRERVLYVLYIDCALSLCCSSTATASTTVVKGLALFLSTCICWILLSFPLFGRVPRVSSRGRRILQLREREKKESVPQSWSSFSFSLPVTCWDTIELNGRVVSKRANRFHPSYSQTSCYLSVYMSISMIIDR